MKTPKLINIQTFNDLNLHLKFEDGTEGIIDFGSKELSGVLDQFRTVEFFTSAQLNNGVIHWPDEIEIHGSSLYLELTGMYFQKLKDKQHRNMG